MLNLQTLKDIYLALPDWSKKPLEVIPPSLILGASYRKQARLLKESNRWDDQEFKKYQLRKLFNTVEQAATTVPYYRDLFQSNKLPAKLQSIEQFLSLPLLSKEIIKEEGERMISDSVPATLRYPVTTGGTSGTPMKFWMSSSAYRKEWSFVHDLLMRYGISPFDRKIGLRGVPFPKAEEGIYCQHNQVYRELQISPFHLSEEVINEYLPLIKKYGAKYIHGYPSSVSQFAVIAEKKQIGRKLGLKGVLLVSETVYPHQIATIEKAFDCPVISFYGHSERLIFAGNKPNTLEYFVDPRYGYTEIIDGELVGTGFINNAMPMLRYKTGDYVTVKDPCGTNGVESFMRLSKVDGRWLQEMLIGKNGGYISVTALNMHSELFANVQRFQFYQEIIGKCELRIVPAHGFVIEMDSKTISKAFRDKVGHELDIVIKIVDSVEMTNRGKQMFLVQKIKLEQEVSDNKRNW
ncbi:MAG: hypothetical protein ABW168_27435 [Sedimenticola sp.]